MISILIAIVVFIGIFIYFIREEKGLKKEERHPFMCALMSFTISVIVWLAVDLFVWTGFAIGGIEQTEVEVVDSSEIVALQDTSSVSGSFFLGSGSVNNNDYYVFYIDTESGYKREKINADSDSAPVYIKYITSDNEVPHIDSYDIRVRKTLKADPRWFSVFASGKYRSFNVGDVISEEETWYYTDEHSPDDFRYEIYIPEGSIQENYVIDLK